VSVAVLTAVTGAWEAPLVAGLERSPGEVHVVRRCVDLAELLSAAAAGLGRAAVVSADLQRLDREALAQLAQACVAVVGLHDPDDEVSRHRLESLGVARVLPADTAPDRIAAAVADAAQELLDRQPDRSRAARVALADPADALAVRLRSADPVQAQPQVRSWSGAARGTVIAVWGPTGAPGRTTVALTLAAELAGLGASTLIVDADTYGASVAQALGMLDESGGIAGAVRSANQGALTVERLARLAPAILPRLRVLTGLPRPSRWPELRPSALDALWDRARDLSAWTVIDCGFSLEVDEELSFDTAAPRRNGATLSALAAADLVIAVGTADPVGLQRLVRGLADLGDALGPASRQRVVITRVRAASVGPGAERRVTDALARYAGVHDALLVPDDPAGCDAAMLAGRTLTESVPSSPARRALSRLAVALEAGAPTQTQEMKPRRAVVGRATAGGPVAGGAVTP
jgi:MinD-like ATPase involved in chromosome partitioning or flagellar assembly